jgi:hypothetical protein
VSNDTEKSHLWIPWCDASQGGGPPPGCQDDANEPNNNPTDATQVSDGLYPELQICAGSNADDYFEVTASGSVTVTIQFDHGQGDLDMELFRGSESVDTSAGTDNQETVTASGGGTYVVRVYGYSGAEGTYSLQVVTD